MDNSNLALEGLIYWGILIVLYLAPTFIAVGRKHYNGGAIFMLNLFLGWTFIGWVASLVWSFTGNVDKTKYSILCPQCHKHYQGNGETH